VIILIGSVFFLPCFTLQNALLLPRIFPEEHICWVMNETFSCAILSECDFIEGRIILLIIFDAHSLYHCSLLGRFFIFAFSDLGRQL
jgi:hypothetical protein